MRAPCVAERVEVDAILLAAHMLFPTRALGWIGAVAARKLLDFDVVACKGNLYWTGWTVDNYLDASYLGIASVLCSLKITAYISIHYLSSLAFLYKTCTRYNFTEMLYCNQASFCIHYV